MTEEAPAYTIFANLGTISVADRFEVHFSEWNQDTGAFHIDDNGEGHQFYIGAGDSVEVSGWTFTITYFSPDTAQFTVTSPDGETFPQPREN